MPGFSNDTVFFNNIDPTGNAIPLGKFNAQGQLLIGTGNASPASKIGSIVSPNSTINFGYNAVTGNITADITGGKVALETLSDDIGSIVFPTSNNIQIAGHVVEQGPSKFSTVTAPGGSILNINPMSASRWIVDPLGFNGTHTTIASAIASATAGDTIFLLPGQYTENLTLKDRVNIAAYRGSGKTGSVNIIGNATMNTAGTVSISGVRLTTNGSFVITNSGTLATIINIVDCDFQASNNTLISFTNSNAAAQINVVVCSMDLNIAGVALHSMTSVGTLSYRYTNITNSGGSSTASSNSAGIVQLLYCNMLSPLATTASGVINKSFCAVDTSAQNVACLTTAGTGTTTVIFGSDASGTSSAISVGAGTTVSAHGMKINSSNTNAVTGAGTLNFGPMQFTGTSSTINVTTQIPHVVANFAWKVVTPGAYPYTTVPQDAVILVDTSAARTIIPLASPTTGQRHIIKDSVGSAATNPITITPSGKNIDGLASRTINSNYSAVEIIYNGTEWSII